MANTPEYNRSYYAKRKANDPEWYERRKKYNNEEQKKKYHKKQDLLFEKHLGRLNIMFRQGNLDEAEDYLKDNFTMKVVKKGKVIL